MAARLRTGDRVVVLAGRDKGKSGEILRVLRKDNRALVGGVNQVVRHQRDTRERPGGRVTIEAPIHLSNLALEDPDGGGPTRVGFRIEDKDGKSVRVRFARKSGKMIDG